MSTPQDDVEICHQELHASAAHSDPSTSLPRAIRRKLPWYKMAFICFVLTSGGPFGAESAVRNGGALLALCGVFGVVLLHVFPMILIVTELSSWMPTNHGSILWIDRAYGHEVGFVSSMLQLVTAMVDLAVYPVLASDYIGQQLTFPNDGTSYAMSLAVMLVASIPAFLTTNDLGSASLVAMVFICAPFLVGFVAGVGSADPSSWVAGPPRDVSFPTLVSVSIWMFTGFLDLGALGGEVESHRAFLVGCGSAAILDVTMYLLPLSVALQVRGEWDDGFFVTAFDTILPRLGTAVMIAGIISETAMYASAITCYSRSLWATADKGWLPSVFRRLSWRTGSPYVAALFFVMSTTILINFDFDFLVTVELVISAINFLLFYTGFLVLRYREPLAHRPFRIGGGKILPWLLVSPIIVVYFTLFVSGMTDWRIVIGVVFTAVVLFLTYHFFVKAKHLDRDVIADVDLLSPEGSPIVAAGASSGSGFGSAEMTQHMVE